MVVTRQTPPVCTLKTRHFAAGRLHAHSILSVALLGSGSRRGTRGALFNGAPVTRLGRQPPCRSRGASLPPTPYRGSRDREKRRWGHTPGGSRGRAAPFAGSPRPAAICELKGLDAPGQATGRTRTARHRGRECHRGRSKARGPTCEGTRVQAGEGPGDAGWPGAEGRTGSYLRSGGGAYEVTLLGSAPPPGRRSPVPPGRRTSPWSLMESPPCPCCRPHGASECAVPRRPAFLSASPLSR